MSQVTKSALIASPVTKSSVGKSPVATLEAPELTLQKVIHHVLDSGKITSAERIWFRRALLTEAPLDAEMMFKVRQMFDRVKMGLIKVVD